jgi:hypothetical protein
MKKISLKTILVFGSAVLITLTSGTGFLAASGNNEYTPVEKSISDSVKDFGARGDGIADDTDAIIAAVKGSLNGLVNFPRGSYRITRTIDIVLSEYGTLSLTGNGASSRVIMDGKGPAFRFIGSHHGASNPPSVTPGIWQKERMPMVYNLEIVGLHPEANGLEFSHTMQMVVRNVLIRNVHHGIVLSSLNRNVLITDCHIYDNSGIGIFLKAVNLHQIIISDNHISFNQLGGIKASSNSNIRNLQITGNDIEYNYRTNIQVKEYSARVGKAPEVPVSAEIWIDCTEGGSICEGTISGNTIQGTPKPGSANILFTGPTGDNQVIGQWSITGNHLSNQMINIHLNHTHGISITGNTFNNGDERNIVISNSLNVILSANIFDHNVDGIRNFNPTGDPYAPGGITISESRNVVLGDNIIYGVKSNSGKPGSAIFVSESREILIRGCLISDPKDRGIRINNSQNVFVTDCRIYEEKPSPYMISAIELTGICTGSVIRNNIIGQCSDRDIINNSAGVTIEGNITENPQAGSRRKIKKNQ